MLNRYYFYKCKISHNDSFTKKTIIGIFKHKSIFKNPIKAKELIIIKTLDGYSDGHKALVTEMNSI